MKLSRRSFVKTGLLYLPAVRALSQTVAVGPWYRGCHPVARDWADRVVKNGGGFPLPATLLPVSNFCSSLGSLLGRIYHCNVCSPDDIFALRTPLIKTYGNDPWVRKTLGSPVTTPDNLTINGWLPSGDRFNCYVYDTGIIPNSVTQWTTSNGGASCYITTNATTNLISNGVLGTFDNTNYFDVRPDLAGFNTCTSFVFDAATGTSGTADHGGGFFLMSRTSTIVGVMYQARSNLAWAQLGTTDTTAAGGKPTTNCYAGGDNYPSTVIHGSAVRYSWFGWHDGFSSADGQTLFNLVDTMRRQMGGGFL